MLNQVPAQSKARQPRGMVRLNDVLATGWVSWEVDSNTFYQADTFRVDFAISALPAGMGADWFASQPVMLVEILAGFPADAENYGRADLDSLILGLVDDVTFDPVARSITLSGRDLTSRLIDAKTIEKWPNLTASQIAIQLAIAHGLVPKVTQTDTKAGTYYQIDHVRVQTGERSVWDLLTWLAHEENMQVYVQGNELHFEPFMRVVTNTTTTKKKPTPAEIAAQQSAVDAAKAALDAQAAKVIQQAGAATTLLHQYQANPTPELRAQVVASNDTQNQSHKEMHEVQDAAYQAALAKLKAMKSATDILTTISNAYPLKWQAPTAEQGFPVFNGTSLTFARNLTLAKDVIVEIRSWNAKNKKGFTARAQATHNKNTVLKGAAQPYGDAQVYAYTFPGLTPDQASKKAQAMLAEITQHEMILDATLPADNLLTTRNVIQVMGTATAFDQIYYPDSIRREMSMDSGYRMTVHAKNMNPETVTQL